MENLILFFEVFSINGRGIAFYRTERKKNMVKRNEVLRQIAKTTGLPISTVREVLFAQDALIMETLAREETIHVMKGIVLGSKRSVMKYYNVFTKQMEVSDRIHVFARFGGTFKKKINTLYDEEYMDSEAPF